MKRLFLLLIGLVFVLTPAVIQAEQKALLGTVNFAVKVDRIAFTDSFFSDDLQDDVSAYVGIEGYGKIAPNIYLGGEVGYSSVSSDHLFSGLYAGEHHEIDADFIFLELNAKYAKDLGRYFVIDAGGGLSCNRAEVTFETHDWIDTGSGYEHTITDSREESEWLFGGQIFADLTFKYHWFSLGFNAKYQVTGDFEDSESGTAFSLNNWRVGMQIGVLF